MSMGHVLEQYCLRVGESARDTQCYKNIFWEERCCIFLSKMGAFLSIIVLLLLLESLLELRHVRKGGGNVAGRSSTEFWPEIQLISDVVVRCDFGRFSDWVQNGERRHFELWNWLQWCLISPWNSYWNGRDCVRNFPMKLLGVCQVRTFANKECKLGDRGRCGHKFIGSVVMQWSLSCHVF